MAIFNYEASFLAFSDTLDPGNNPRRRNFEWKPRHLQVPVGRPLGTEVDVPPLQDQLVFDGTRTLTADGTTAYSLLLTSLDPSTYRLTRTAGTQPGFRAARAVTTSGGTLTLAVRANGLAAATHSAGAVFGAVVVGDQVLVPGPATGDPATPFDPLNQGLWGVLAASATTLTLGRPPGSDFAATGQAVAVTDDAQFQVFAAVGVQPGDTLDLLGGFAAGSLATYPVTAVRAAALDFTSTAALPDQLNVTPGAQGVRVYSSAKRWVRVESDQPIAVLPNGDTSGVNRVQPLQAGDPEQTGWWETWGPVYALTLRSRSTATANVNVFSVE